MLYRCEDVINSCFMLEYTQGQDVAFLPHPEAAATLGIY
jgi:hypothetical protein